MEKEVTYLVIKFVNTDNIESLENEGIFFPALSQFIHNDGSLTDAQVDSQEGRHTTILDKEKEIIKIGSFETNNFVEFPFDSAEINLQLPEEEVGKMFISSFTLLNSATDFEPVGDCLKIKNSVVDGLSEIANGRPFVITSLDNLKQAIYQHFHDEKYTVYDHSVMYRNNRYFMKGNLRDNPIELAFTKNEAYADQKEYRVLAISRDGIRPENMKVALYKNQDGSVIFSNNDLKTLTIQ